MLKIVTIINDLMEKNRIKSYLAKAKNELPEFEFELSKEFEDYRHALNFLYQDEPIDILIIEDFNRDNFEGLDFIMLAAKEFPESSLILTYSASKELDLSSYKITNLAAILSKSSGYKNFKNIILFTLLKHQAKNAKIMAEQQKLTDYRTIIDHTHDAIFLLEIDCDNNFYYKRINETHYNLTGLKAENVIGKTTAEIFGEAVAAQMEENYQRCVEQKRKINYTEEIEFPGGKRVFQTALYPVIKQGEVKEIVGASKDITELESWQAELEYFKQRDKLTGLYNEEYFNNYLPKVIELKNLPLVVIVIDIVGFNLLNKLFSTTQANSILEQTAAIAADLSRENEVAARVSSNQFALVLKKRSIREFKVIMTELKARLAAVKIAGIPIDFAVVGEVKLAKLPAAKKFYANLMDKLKLEKYNYRHTANSRFCQGVLESIAASKYKLIGHGPKLIERATMFAAHFELNRSEKEKFILLAKYHDIGKLGLDQNILKKGDLLTALEWEEYQHHIERSANFISHFYDLTDIFQLVYHHHEYYDGSGYPDCLQGIKIPYLNRIFSILDFYDAVSSNIFYPFLQGRYFFAELNKQQIAGELKKYQGSIFDPRLVDKFVEKVLPEI